MAVGFNYPSVWLLGWLGFAVFLSFFYSKVDTIKTAFWSGLSFGAGFLGSVLVWFWHTLPLTWLGVESQPLSWGLVLFYWGSVVAALSLFVGLWCLLFFLFKRGKWHDALVCAALWVLFEYARMWGFAFLTLGDESLISPHFSVGLAGYFLASSPPLLQLANWGGVYTLGFLFVFLGFIWYWFASHLLISQSNRKRALLIVATFLFLACLYIPAHFGVSEGKSVISIAVLNTYFPPSLRISPEESAIRFSEYARLLAEIAESREDPTVIVFPEDTRFLQQLETRGELDSFFTALFGSEEKLIIDSGRTHTARGAVRQQFYFYDTQTHALTHSEKQYLVPQGEYTPYLYRGALYLLGQTETLKRLQTNRSYGRGALQQPVRYRDLSIGTLFCSELLSPSLYRNVADMYDTNMLVNVASQSWFHGSRILYNQTIAIAKVHAVENRQYFIQASNGSPSFVIDSRGVVVREGSWEENSVLYSEIVY